MMNVIYFAALSPPLKRYKPYLLDLSSFPVLVSRITAEKSSCYNLRHTVGENRLMMIDCGAFSAKGLVIKYSLDGMLYYYKSQKADVGVTVDLRVTRSDSAELKYEKMMRTYRYALRMLEKHDGSYTLLAVVQGADATDFYTMIRAYVKRGIRKLAIGGTLASMSAKDVISCMKYLKRAGALDNLEWLHLFGFTKLTVLGEVARLCKDANVRVLSFDSSSPLLSIGQGWIKFYYKGELKTYPMLVPRKGGKYSYALKILFESLDKLDAKRAYELYKKVDPRAERFKDKLLDLFSEKPFLYCDCPACKKYGIRVLFKAAPYSYAAGLHNIHAYRKCLNAILKGINVQLSDSINTHE